MLPFESFLLYLSTSFLITMRQMRNYISVMCDPEGYAYPKVHGTYRLRWACGNERADPMERGIKTIYNEEIQSTLRLMTITRRHLTVCLSVFDGIAVQKDN
ncbi:hypothetical protein Bca4012_046551 [Brassica carinata]